MLKNNNNNQSIDKTELIWPGKRKEVERVELPFQTIETINLPRGVRQEEIFDKRTDWKNRLIWGDNLLVMGSLLKELAGKINLIYIDPPFATGDDFSFTVNIGDSAEVTKEPSALEVKAYRDTWGKGMQSYLQMMYDRLVLMKELLADNGSIYIHLDWHVGHYVKLMMDEIFGKENLVNDIIWSYQGTGAPAKGFKHKHDIILLYSKTPNFYFDVVAAGEKLTEKQKQKYTGVDKEGIYKEYQHKDGSIKRQYWDESKLMRMRDVWEISTIQSWNEKLNYQTQKPEKLLERIVSISSKEGDIVADFFCGSGTTGAVAEKLGRFWIMSDLGRFAMHTARKRLLDMRAKPFVVQNLGKYERHRWAEINGKYKDYTKFILELYHAESVNGFTHLHGKKAKSFVFIHSDDDPYCPLAHAEFLSKKLGGELLVKKGHKHFSVGTYGEEYKKFPYLLELIEKK